MAKSTAIRVDKIVKKYGNVVASDGVSFEVGEGEFMSLLGPSGCGKTTVLNMIAGFIKPDSGSIYLSDQKIDDEPINERNTAMVFQNYALFPHLSIFENIAYGLKVRKFQSREIERLVKDVLQLVQLPDIKSRYPRELSGGQQQRVALARALVLNPKVLLLDEPLSNLDAKLREDMRFELREIQKKVEITTIFVTHDIQEAFSLSDRIAVMRNGRIEQISAPFEIYESPSTEYIANFIGRPNFFRGEILSIEDDALKVRTNQSDTLVVPNPKNLTVGQSLRILVWPEKIAVRKNPSGNMENSLRGKIVRCTYLGSHIDYLVEACTDPITLIVSCPNVDSNFVGLGETVYLEWGKKANIIL